MTKSGKDLGRPITELDYEEIKTDEYYVKKYNDGKFEARISKEYQTFRLYNDIELPFIVNQIKIDMEPIIIPISTVMIKISILTSSSEPINEMCIGRKLLSESKKYLVFNIISTEELPRYNQVNAYIIGYWK